MAKFINSKFNNILLSATLVKIDFTFQEKSDENHF